MSIEENSVFMTKVQQFKQATQVRGNVMNVTLNDFARAYTDLINYLETQCNLLRGRVQELEEKYEPKPKESKEKTPEK